MAGERPGIGGLLFGNIGVELRPSDALSLILSSHDRQHTVSHPLCMDELYCIMFF